MQKDQSSLEGKVAIVTGGSYGPGVAFAGALADAGADIVVSARSVDKVQGTNRSSRRKGGDALPWARTSATTARSPA